ncbi:outer membrane protein assembly factor BamA [Fluviispira sanaruensis]|uniref:Outer membrane protein assembly factor BamA n=1 Tax=Fluviispira sanaruensis TaxID=2493639 RepID=A0A4P2VNG2_FLUSA|nr:outer membrane protein assembly factor BamA [Fluviispira sanaruensis]BBH54408.1 outer membrane protein assembly factor BamA [Fluviispira sanaruensis]
MFGLKKYRFLDKTFIFGTSSLVLALAGQVVAQTPLQQPTAQALHGVVSKITIIGNKTVTNEAILNLMSIKQGTNLTANSVAKDIKSIFSSSYFQDVKFDLGLNGELIISVIEKPTVHDILYEGFDIVSSSSLKDKIVTKKYTIVDEKKLSQDLRSIEQAYIEKGYYLAKASYTLESTQSGSVNIVFKIKENRPIEVRKVNLLGNDYFSDSELQSFMVTKPFSWNSILTSSGLFRDEYVAADQQNITYYYRDNGYAESTVIAPISRLTRNKKDINVSFFIEEGERFNIGSIKILGDLIENEEEIKNKLLLKEKEIYRISKFNYDMKNLKVIYGDQGYAFTYIYPTFNIDRAKKLYNINYTITKGEKAYIRKITIEGNVKTRDNVIRRAIKINEGQLFNATKIEKSKSLIEKLGYFETVQLVQEPDQAHNAVDIKVLVKEKSTGSLSASLGASPDTNGSSGLSFFGQLQYQERNLIGKAYGVGANVQISPSPRGNGSVNYTLSLNFGNPSIYDGPWSFGTNLTTSLNEQSVTTSSSIEQVYITQTTNSFGFSIGREILENLRFNLGYNISETNTDPSVPLTQKFYASGRTEKISQTLTYDITDNYVSPTSGLFLSGTNAFGFELFGGQYKFGTMSGLGALYIPLDFSENYRTNFRIAFQPKYVYQTSKSNSVPYWERLTLGNSYYMKGYSGPGEALTTTAAVAISPITGQTTTFTIGGNRSFYGVIEYFVPIIPQAGLRLVTFGEAGTVLDDYDTFSFDKIKYDIGFGFRWTTPIAPFRFEWAFPIEQGNIGKAHFIFSIGTDSFNNNM